MALSNYFYFSLLKKYVTLFGYIFDDIRIERFNTLCNETELFRVPITYGPKDKMLARVIEDPNIQRQDAIQLPLLSFEMNSFQYDKDRKIPTMNRQSYVYNTNTGNQMNSQYAPVPYNIGFSLYIYTKNTEDGNKIVEQILPFFTPDWTVTAELIPEMNITVDIPVILDSVNMEDTYDGDFKKRRVLIWTLNFTLKAYMYGPVTTSGVIKFVTINIRDMDSPTTPDSVITAQPGLDANGNPTSNASISIPYNEIFANNNYGYIISINEPTV